MVSPTVYKTPRNIKDATYYGYMLVISSESPQLLMVANILLGNPSLV